MISNFVSIIVMTILFWIVGRFLVNRIIKMDEQFSFAYSAVGTVVVAVITSILYFRLGMSMMSIAIVMIVIAIITMGVQIKSIKKRELLQLGIQIGLFLILIIPGLIRGEQYYVYRGNFFDQFIYLSEGITTYRFTWHQLAQMDLSKINDVYRFGIDLLHNDRPPVTLVYALLLTGSKGNIFFEAYMYHALFMSMIFQPLYEMVKHITGKWWVATVIATGYLFGFYGQIQFDINAWSHICTIALFIVNAYVVMLFFEDAYENRINRNYICNVNILILMNIIMVGGMIYYVENWSIQYVLSCVTILFMCILKKYKVSVKQICAMLTIPVTSIIVSLIACPQVVSFLKNQITSSIEGKVDYGPYWYNWLFGFWNTDSIPSLAKIPAVFTSLFGASIYVPAWNKSRIIVMTWEFVFSAIVVLLIVNVTARLAKAINGTSIGEQFLSVWFLTCIILGGVLYFKAGHYGFVKYVLYVSPYLWVSATLSIDELVHETKIRKVGVRSVAILSAMSLLLGSLAMVGLRTLDTAKNKKCYGYSGSYPSDQDPGLKNSHWFKLNLDNIKDAKVVQIEAEFPFYLYYMKLSLLYAGKEYYSNENHVYYINDDVEMEKPDIIDAVITLEENTDGMLEPKYR